MFKAKNENDELDLQIKFRDVGACFINENLIYVLEHKKSIRVYNISEPTSKTITRFPIQSKEHCMLIRKYEDYIFIGCLDG